MAWGNSTFYIVQFHKKVEYELHKVKNPNTTLTNLTHHQV